jgi:leucyl-tRNA synthetase
MSELARTIENRRKTGVFTGSFVVNPITGEQLPVYVGDYVLMTVGTGALMGVPAHDERDFDFARTFQIDIRPVILPEDESADVMIAVAEGEMAWMGPGRMVPSKAKVFRELGLEGEFNNVAGKRIVDWLEEFRLGRRVLTYKIRDWLFSRQRYWGEPIPIVHWEDGVTEALSEKDLPLLLPAVEDYRPSDGGESPLARAEEWLTVVDPKTGRKGRRETNTMPDWAGSCWYYLRFIDPKNETCLCDPELEKKWMPVDLYVGGAEHAVLHLLYSRFWHKVLFDLGLVSTSEPFGRLFNQGMIQAQAYKDRRGALIPVDQVEVKPDGSAVLTKSGDALERNTPKMSKSLKNVVTPDEIVEEYSADTLRMYEMFMGPLESSRVWDPKAIAGNYRFLKRAWALVTANRDEGVRDVIPMKQQSPAANKSLSKMLKR